METGMMKIGRGRGRKGGSKREDKRREGWREGKNLVQQVTGTLVCQSGGRQDGRHASPEPQF